MKMKIFISRSLFVAALSSLFLFTSCDEHEAIDLGIHPGYILCADGTVVSDQSFFEQGNREPAAVIFTEQQGEGSGCYFLAVMVKELPHLQFCDSTSMVQGTDTDINNSSADIGKLNTTALQNSYDSKTKHGSPLADYVFANHNAGQSDFIPSVRELKLLYFQRDRVNSVLGRLNTFSEGSADLLRTDSCWYWSSTEVAANPSRQAWLFSMSSGTPHETPKMEFHAARSIVYYRPYN